MARVGLLGGTFNPPHLAHLVMAQEAWAQLELDRVVWLPVHTPSYKEAEGDPGPEVRLELCRLAVAGDPRFAVSDVEVRRGGATYTVDTLEALAAEAPGDELVFVVGGDQALALPAWRAPQRVLELAVLGVGERSGIRRADIEERLAGLAPPDRLRFFDMPRLDVSSSEVRARVAAGRPVRYLVPDAVGAVIDRDGLYLGGVDQTGDAA